MSAKKVYTSKESNEILKISVNLPVAERRAKLLEVANKYGRGYAAVYAFWNANVMHKNKKISPPVATAVDLYKIEPDVVVTRARVDLEPIKEKIKPLVKQLQPLKGTIPIMRTNAPGLLKWLNETYAPMQFGTSKVADNNKVVRLYRKG